MKRIAIIGGGIAGLSAAYRAELLRRSGAAEYTLFEQSPRLGGVIRTETIDGCLVEGGPDSFLSEKAAGANFCRELGIGDQLIGSNDADRKTNILIKRRLVPLPDGLMFLVPTRILPMAFTPLFSLGTKLRFAQEWFVSPRSGTNAEDDESVAAFVRRHFGDEVVDRLADPLLSGIYGGSAERLSARSVLPRMIAMEEKHGSLTRAMLAARRNVPAPAAGATARPLFTSLRGGMQQMVDAAAAQLDPASIRLQTTVRALEKTGNGWRVHADSGPLDFDGIVLAMPAYATGALLARVRPDLAQELAAVPYTSSITAVLAYDAAQVRNVDFSGHGFLVPRSQGKRMLACTFVHHKFPHRAPAGRVLLRCFLGGENAAAALTLNDDQIVGSVRDELREILRLAAEPLFARVYRWQRAMAQYEVGHARRLRQIEQWRRELPGLALAGNAYQGIGVPDCIRTGAEAVAEITGAPLATKPAAV